MGPMLHGAPSHCRTAVARSDGEQRVPCGFCHGPGDPPVASPARGREGADEGVRASASGWTLECVCRWGVPHPTPVRCPGHTPSTGLGGGGGGGGGGAGRRSVGAFKWGPGPPSDAPLQTRKPTRIWGGQQFRRLRSEQYGSFGVWGACMPGFPGFPTFFHVS